ncbi:MAG: hypothetical protein M3Q69_02290 [Acidobacteriota bacterium]|nr:hypothetical protein [Acidobacteriota bacterium]
MGKLDALDLAEKKLTIQTEFFARPEWRVETKVYLGGALKKVFTEDLSSVGDGELQARVNAFHDARLEEIVNGLKARKAQ